MDLTIPRLTRGNHPVGWWLDQDTIDLYHGTATCNLPSIAANGILATDSAYLTPDYRTAEAYSIFGPDGGDRSAISGYRAGRPLYIRSLDSYAVVHVAMPRALVEQLGYYRPYTIISQKLRLSDRTLYDQSDAPDCDYYYFSEVLFDYISPDHIIGYSLPYADKHGHPA